MSMHMSGGGVNPTAPGGGSKGLVIATDALTIYEAGSQYQISIEEVLSNPVALKMLFNELNQAKHELAAAKQGSIPPGITIALAVVNGIGVAIVAVGSVQIGMNPSPPGAAWVLGLGITISLIATVTPAVLALVKSRKQRVAASPEPTSPGGEMDRTDLYEYIRAQRERYANERNARLPREDLPR